MWELRIALFLSYGIWLVVRNTINAFNTNHIYLLPSLCWCWIIVIFRLVQLRAYPPSIWSCLKDTDDIFPQSRTQVRTLFHLLYQLKSAVNHIFRKKHFLLFVCQFSTKQITCSIYHILFCGNQIETSTKVRARTKTAFFCEKTPLLLLMCLP